MDNIFTFWEGPQPDYIKLCIRTWPVNYTLLTYDNIKRYTDIDPDKLKPFSLQQAADYIRVHVLRDNGGYWLDADTIMVTGKLPDTDMVGDPVERTNSIGLLHTEPGSDMFTEWAEYQDGIVDKAKDIKNLHAKWDILSNSFTDRYVAEHEDIRIHDITNYWPETYMIKDPKAERRLKYLLLYFSMCKRLEDIKATDMIMLHNSWTPGWYKQLSESDILCDSHTLSNILTGLLK